MGTFTSCGTGNKAISFSTANELPSSQRASCLRAHRGRTGDSPPPSAREDPDRGDRHGRSPRNCKCHHGAHASDYSNPSVAPTATKSNTTRSPTECHKRVSGDIKKGAEAA